MAYYPEGNSNEATSQDQGLIAPVPNIITVYEDNSNEPAREHEPVGLIDHESDILSVYESLFLGTDDPASWTSSQLNACCSAWSSEENLGPSAPQTSQDAAVQDNDPSLD